MKPAQCNLGHKYTERIEGNKGEGYFLFKINISINLIIKDCSIV